MTIDSTILFVKRELISAFAVLDEWFDKEEKLYHFKPSNEAKNVRQVLAYALLTTKYLLPSIDEGGAIALQETRTENITAAVMEYCFDIDELRNNGINDLFEGVQGRIKLDGVEWTQHEMRMHWRDCLDRYLCHLELLNNGEGIFSKIKPVDGIEEMDLYEAIYSLAQHIKRFIPQLREIEIEYDKQAV